MTTNAAAWSLPSKQTEKKEMRGRRREGSRHFACMKLMLMYVCIWGRQFEVVGTFSGRSGEDNLGQASGQGRRSLAGDENCPQPYLRVDDFCIDPSDVKEPVVKCNGGGVYVAEKGKCLTQVEQTPECPEGFGLMAWDLCVRKTQLLYKCPADYTREVNDCKKDTFFDLTPVCPNDAELVDQASFCLKTEPQAPQCPKLFWLDPGFNVCLYGLGLDAIPCPEGYGEVSENTAECQRQVAAEPVPMCDVPLPVDNSVIDITVRYVPSSGRCEAEHHRAPVCEESAFSLQLVDGSGQMCVRRVPLESRCPEGTSPKSRRRGAPGNMLECEVMKDIEPEFTCPRGHVPRAGKCARIAVHEPSEGCPKGFKQLHQACVKHSDLGKPQIRCPKMFQLQSAESVFSRPSDIAVLPVEYLVQGFVCAATPGVDLPTAENSPMVTDREGESKPKRRRLLTEVDAKRREYLELLQMPLPISATGLRRRLEMTGSLGTLITLKEVERGNGVKRRLGGSREQSDDTLMLRAQAGDAIEEEPRSVQVNLAPVQISCPAVRSAAYSVTLGSCVGGEETSMVKQDCNKGTYDAARRMCVEVLAETDGKERCPNGSDSRRASRDDPLRCTLKQAVKPLHSCPTAATERLHQTAQVHELSHDCLVMQEPKLLSPIPQVFEPKYKCKAGDLVGAGEKCHYQEVVPKPINCPKGFVPASELPFVPSSSMPCMTMAKPEPLPPIEVRTQARHTCVGGVKMHKGFKCKKVERTPFQTVCLEGEVNDDATECVQTRKPNYRPPKQFWEEAVLTCLPGYIGVEQKKCAALKSD